MSQKIDSGKTMGTSQILTCMEDRLKKSLVFEAVTGKRKVSATLTQRAQMDAESVGADVLGRPPGCEADRINRIYRIESEMPAAANAKDAEIRKDGDESLRSFENSAFSATAPAGSQNPVNPVNPVEETSRSMRDSGVAWIGAVPEGWMVAKGKYFLSVKSGDAIRNEELRDRGGFPVYGGGDRIGFNENWNVDADVLLMGRVGARCGCVTKLRGKSWATDNALVVSTAIDRDFTFYLLEAADLNKENFANAQPLITGYKVKPKNGSWNSRYYR